MVFGKRNQGQMLLSQSERGDEEGEDIDDGGLVDVIDDV